MMRMDKMITLARSRIISGMLTSVLLILGTVLTAHAQWRVSDTSHAWSDYNSYFLFTHSDGYSQQFSYYSGDHPNVSGMWEAAQQIQMAVDAYEWAVTNDPTNLTSYKNEVEGLCDGYVNFQTKNNTTDPNGAGSLVGDNWAAADDGNDDVLWAVLAFVRAYAVTGTTRWLTDAENNFNAVYSRGYDTTFGGGIWWDADHSSSTGYKNSPSNWTFVQAGYLINGANGGTGSYKSKADTVYNWAKSKLYVSSTGQIYDGWKTSGAQTGEYTYNYGSAIDAFTEEGNTTAIHNVSSFAMNSLGNYVAVIGGYNILPNYGTGYNSGGGYNGILLRAIGHANSHGAITSSVLAWAQANVTQAWTERDADGVGWDNWDSVTPLPGSSTYSWDCTDMVVGMLDLPSS